MNKLTLGLTIVAIALSLAVASTLGLYSYRLHKRLDELNERFDNIEWTETSNGMLSDLTNPISPSVGTIQFLKNGFSIELSEVNFTQGGLQLAGYVGNPTNLWLSNLTLEFHAYKPLYSMHEEFLKSLHGSTPFFLPIPDEIGHAQSKTITILAPSQMEEFHTTIPNVTQTKEGFILTVQFTGERYSFRPYTHRH